MTSREQASGAPAEAPRRGTTRWLRGAAVGLLLTLIVFASRRVAWSHPGSSDALVWPAEIATVFAGVALAAGAVLLLALAQWLAPWRRRGDPTDPPRAPRRIRLGVRGWAALGLIAIAVGCTVAVAIGELGRQEARPTTPGPVGVGRAPQGQPASPAPGPGAPIKPVVLLIAGGALLAGLSLAAVAGRSRPARRAAIEPAPRLARRESRAVQEPWPADARLAAFAAYRRAEQLLGAAGVPRDAAEGPREYLARVCGERSRGPLALDVLTSRYERARFSPRTVGQQQRAEALAAVRELERELKGRDPR